MSAKPSLCVNEWLCLLESEVAQEVTINSAPVLGAKRKEKSSVVSWNFNIFLLEQHTDLVVRYFIFRTVLLMDYN